MDTTELGITYWQVIIVLMLLGGLSFLAAFIENKTRPKVLYFNKQIKLFEAAIILFICLTGIFWFAIKNEIVAPFGILALGLKLIISFIVAGQAKKLGRNQYLWFFLSFIEFHFALIVLGLNPKLLSANSATRLQVEKLNQETLEQKSGIRAAYNNNIIDRDTMQQRADDLKTKYQTRLSQILSSDMQQQYLNQLDQALKTGAITKDEFEIKIKAE